MSGSYEQVCPVCSRPGARSGSRAEARHLTDLHNHLHHRGRAAASVRRRWFR